MCQIIKNEIHKTLQNENSEDFWKDIVKCLSENKQIEEPLTRESIQLLDNMIRVEDFEVEKYEIDDINFLKPIKEENRKRSIQKPKRFLVKKRTKNTKNWRDIEYIFLAGLTMYYLSMKHSLKESRRDKGKASGGNDTVAWRCIGAKYDKARIRWNELRNECLPARTPGALNKKWKGSGDKNGTTEDYLENEEKLSSTTVAFFQFMNIYNKNCILTCNEDKYVKLKTKYFNKQSC